MMKMNRSVTLMIVVLCLGAGIGQLAAQQNGYDLFQKALAAERADGNLRQAIQLYERVTREFTADRTLVARALLRMAECYEKLGDAAAQGLYARVMREFPDHPESAGIARARLAASREQHSSVPAGIVSRQIWSGPGVDTLGSIAPDGSALSYVDWDTGDLAIRNLATGTHRRLTNKGPWESSSEFALFSRISPDGRQIAYNWFRNPGWEIRVGPVDGSSYRTVWSSDTDQEYAQPDAWSPDGKRFAGLIVREISQMVIVSLPEGTVRVLKSFDWRSPAAMAFSPDGQYVAYDFQVAEQSPERDVFAIAVDGARDSRVTDHPADDSLLGWLPDGRMLFASDRGGRTDAWGVAMADGRARGAPSMIKRDFGNVLTLGVTRGGSLYYGLRSTGPDVYTIAYDPAAGRVSGEPVRLPQRFIGTNVSPDWSPDGRRIAYVSERALPAARIGAQVLSIADLTTGQQRDVPLPLGYVNRPRWAPDGRRLLVRANDDKGRVSIHAVDSDTGRATLLVRRDGLQMARWSRDGTRIFVVSSSTGDRTTRQQVSRITAHDVTNSAETELFRATTDTPAGNAHINDLAVSPDGGLLAFTVADGRTKAVVTVPTAGGPARELFRSRADFQIPNFAGLSWSPDDREILLTKGGTPDREIWALPVVGGTPRPIGLRAPNIQEAALSPDGRQLVFQTGARTWEIWALENIATPSSQR